MIVAGLIFAVVAVFIHIYIFYLESIAWESERARATFGTGSVEETRTTEFMAFDQGFCSLFLALLATAGVATQTAGSGAVGLTLVFAGIASILVTAAVLFITFAPHRAAALKQGAFPLLTVGPLGLDLMF